MMAGLVRSHHLVLAEAESASQIIRARRENTHFLYVPPPPSVSREYRLQTRKHDYTTLAAGADDDLSAVFLLSKI